MKKVCVLGAGSWGTALAIVLSENVDNVALWTRCEKQKDQINLDRANTKYLKDVKIPNNIEATTDIKEALEGSSIVVLGVPSQAIRSVCKLIKPYIKESQVIVNSAKGLEKETGLRISEVVLEEIPNSNYVVLSGPSHAEEVAKRLATAVVVSSVSSENNISELVQDAFMTEYFRVYTNDDLVGVELGGTIKNIIALGCGICDGLGYGDNARSALITRGLHEMKSFGVSLGAKEDTFNGLSGIGDLIVTCTSKHSRNSRAGYLIGKGCTKEEAVEKVEMVVEGITAVESVYLKSRGLNKEFPILESLYSILFEEKNPKVALLELMNRDKKSEY